MAYDTMHTHDVCVYAHLCIIVTPHVITNLIVTHRAGRQVVLQREEMDGKVRFEGWENISFAALVMGGPVPGETFNQNGAYAGLGGVVRVSALLS